MTCFVPNHWTVFIRNNLKRVASHLCLCCVPWLQVWEQADQALQGYRSQSQASPTDTKLVSCSSSSNRLQGAIRGVQTDFPCTLKTMTINTIQQSFIFIPLIDYFSCLRMAFICCCKLTLHICLINFKCRCKFSMCITQNVENTFQIAKTETDWEIKLLWLWVIFCNIYDSVTFFQCPFITQSTRLTHG